MKILYLSHRIPFPPIKGEKIRSFYQIKSLVERGHKVDIAAPQEQAEDHHYGQQLRLITKGNILLAPKPGKMSLIKGLLQGKALSVSNFYSASLQALIDDLLQSEAVDVIVCTSSCMAAYVFNSPSFNKLDSNVQQTNNASQPKLVMDFMDLDSDKWAQYASNAKWPMRWIYQREARLIAHYEQLIYQQFDSCIFISDAEVNLFSERLSNASKLSIVGNGIASDEFKPPANRQAISKHSLHMLFTGVMDYLPNEDAVCWFVESAWSHVRELYPEATFTIVGMNPSNRVKHLNERPGVHVTGFVDDIMPYFNSANVFLAPFRLARGVQNKVLQAFSCALPTITSSLGIEGIPAQHHQNVFIAEDIPSILEAIAWLVEHPEKGSDIGNAARQLVTSKFSWESQLQPLIDTIECL